MSALLDPSILFFVLGIGAGLLRSNLEVPAQISRFLSLYLLMALGLKGGFALADSGFNWATASPLLAALVMAVLVPLLAYPVLNRLVGRYDAAAIAATYGSVSAVTFITAVQHLENQGIAHGGYMAAAMALMESPAIILAVLFAHRARVAASTVPASTTAVGQGVATLSSTPSGGFGVGGVVKEAFTEGAQVLLLGAMLIGIVSGEAGKQALQPFAGDLFKGMLCFFLLDMGLQVAQNLKRLKQVPARLMAWGVLASPCHALIAAFIGLAAGLSEGDLALLMILAASASYIAVPAAIRHAIPEANPSLYLGLSLGLTFPINILLGIPFYSSLAAQLTSYMGR